MENILNIEEFPDILNKLPYDTNWIKNQIRSNTLKFYPKLDVAEHGITEKHENDNGKYSFVSIFYNFIYHNKKIPNQEEFYNKVHKTFLDDKKYSSLQCKNGFIEGFKGRAYRTYPSLVRDFYLNKLFLESGYNVIYSLKLDLFYGIDTLLIINNKYYGVGMFVDTADGRQKRENKIAKLKKDNRIFNNVEYIDLPIIKDGHCETVGGIWLYTQYHIEKLMEIVKPVLNSVDIS